MIETNFAYAMEKIALAPRVNTLIEGLTGAAIGGAGGRALIHGQGKGRKAKEEVAAGAGAGATVGTLAALTAAGIIRHRASQDIISQLMKSKEFATSKRTAALADEMLDVRLPILERKLPLADTEGVWNRFYDASVSKQNMTPSAVARWRRTLPAKERKLEGIMESTMRRKESLQDRLGDIEMRIGRVGKGGVSSKAATRLRKEIAAEQAKFSKMNRGLGRTQSFLRAAQSVHDDAKHVADRSVVDAKAALTMEIKALHAAKAEATSSHKELIGQFKRKAKEQTGKKLYGVF